MEEWFTSGACDGFVIAATHSPGAYEDMVRLVVPELQRRGVFRDHYAGRRCARTSGCPGPSAPTMGEAPSDSRIHVLTSYGKPGRQESRDDRCDCTRCRPTASRNGPPATSGRAR